MKFFSFISVYRCRIEAKSFSDGWKLLQFGFLARETGSISMKYIYIYFCEYQLASNHKREKIKALIVSIDMCYLIDCFDGPRTVVRIL